MDAKKINPISNITDTAPVQDIKKPERGTQIDTNDTFQHAGALKSARDESRQRKIKDENQEKNQELTEEEEKKHATPQAAPQQPQFIAVETSKDDINTLFGQIEDSQDKNKTKELLISLGKSYARLDKETIESFNKAVSSKDEEIRAAFLNGLLQNITISADDRLSILELFGKDKGKSVQGLLILNLSGFKPLDEKDKRLDNFVKEALMSEDGNVRYNALQKVIDADNISPKEKTKYLISLFKKEKFTPAQYGLIRGLFNLVSDFKEKENKDISRLFVAAALSPEKQQSLDAFSVLLKLTDNFKVYDEKYKHKILKTFLKLGNSELVKGVVEHLIKEKEGLWTDEDSRKGLLNLIKENKSCKFKDGDLEDLIEKIETCDPEISLFKPNFISLWEREKIDSSFKEMTDSEKALAGAVFNIRKGASFSESAAITIHEDKERKKITEEFSDVQKLVKKFEGDEQSILLKLMLLQEKPDIQTAVYKKLDEFDFERKTLLPLLTIGFNSANEEVQLASALNLRKFDLSKEDLAYLSYNRPDNASRKFNNIIDGIYLENLDKIKDLPPEARSNVLKKVFEGASNSTQREILNNLSTFDISVEDAAFIIQKGIKDGNSDVRISAIEKLDDYCFSEGDIKSLINSLPRALNSSEEIAIKSVLPGLFENTGNYSSETCSGIVENLLLSSSDSIRTNVYEKISLLKLNKQSALKIIQRAFNEGEISDVREAAVFSLKKLGASLSEIDDFIGILAQRCPNEITGILGNSPSQIMKETNNLKPSLRNRILEAFYTMDNTREEFFDNLGGVDVLPDLALNYIIKGIKDQNSLIRTSAIKNVERFNFGDNPEVVNLLKEIITKSDPDEKKALSDALPGFLRNNQFTSPQVSGGLYETLLNSDSKEVICQTLKNLSDINNITLDAVFPYIEKHLSSNIKEIQDAAFDAVDKLRK